MRFRSSFGLHQCLRVASAAAWMTLGLFAILRHHPDSFYVPLAVIWTILLIVQITTVTSGSWYLNSDSVLVRGVWSSRTIPYEDIVAIRPVSARRPETAPIQIEFGRVGSAINPRGSIVADPAERSAFLEQLRSHTPTATFEF